MPWQAVQTIAFCSPDFISAFSAETKLGDNNINARHRQICNLNGLFRTNSPQIYFLNPFVNIVYYFGKNQYIKNDKNASKYKKIRFC